MKIVVLMVGKTNQDYITEGMNRYVKRIKHYIPFETEVVPESKSSKKMGIDDFKKQDSEALKKRIKKGDAVIILDEKGKEFDSIDFARFLEQEFNRSFKRLVFVIGGAFGLSDAFKKQYLVVSLSRMTFSHQLIRLLFAEQLYRALTIIKGESYHHA